MVKIYTGQRCPHCQAAKSFFTALGIQFEECSISNPVYKKELQEMGYMSVPVILIGEEKLIGFDKASVVKALEKIGKIS